MGKVKRLVLVVLLLMVGVLLTLAGLGLIQLPLSTMLYFGVGLLVVGISYYFIY